MPVCYITLSEKVEELGETQIDGIRDIVAEALCTKNRILDKNHIVIRIQYSQRKFMLGEVEIVILAQFFLRRFFSRDKRANLISKRTSQLLDKDCATWINMFIMGYSRVTSNGYEYFAD